MVRMAIGVAKSWQLTTPLPRTRWDLPKGVQCFKAAITKADRITHPKSVEIGSCYRVSSKASHALFPRIGIHGPSRCGCCRSTRTVQVPQLSHHHYCVLTGRCSATAKFWKLDLTYGERRWATRMSITQSLSRRLSQNFQELLTNTHGELFRHGQGSISELSPARLGHSI